MDNANTQKTIDSRYQELKNLEEIELMHQAYKLVCKLGAETADGIELRAILRASLDRFKPETKPTRDEIIWKALKAEKQANK